MTQDLEQGSHKQQHIYSSIAGDDNLTKLVEEEGENELNEIGVLPPADRGVEAWRFVLGAWLVEGLGWGFPLSFGIYQAYYSKHELFEASSRSVPMIGTMTAGVCHLCMPLVSPIVQRFRVYERQICWSGGFLCVASFVAASFATKVWHLIVTQGIMLGLGWVFCYVPMLFMLNEWFEKRRGLAYGIVYSASGIGGLVLPFFLEKSLAALDFRWTLRLCAASMLVICGPGLFLMKPRIPKSNNCAKPEYGNASFWKEKVFWLFAVAIFLQALGTWLPRFFLPSYAHDLSLTKTQGAYLLALFSLAQIFGQIALGGAADFTTVHVPTSFSTGVSAAVTFLLWGPGKTFSSLAVFSVLFGAFSAAFSVLMSLIATKYVVDDTATAMTVFGIFMFERGLGGIVGGPMSSLLLGTEIDIHRLGLQKYIGVVWFVGVSMALSTMLVCLAYFLRRTPQALPSDGDASNYRLQFMRSADDHISGLSLESSPDSRGFEQETLLSKDVEDRSLDQAEQR